MKRKYSLPPMATRLSVFAGLAFVLSTNTLLAQTETAVSKEQAVYQASATKINALAHTKLAVKFDYAKRHLIGKAWLTLKPYAYPTDSLTLDAKGMDIRNVSLVNGKSLQVLKYDYNQEQLKIKLGRKFAAGESYTVFVDYTAKPDELKTKGSAAITDAKGLYFINPDGSEKDKPVQIWTQGETEASSVWFPTIDKPNQKTTSEIAITVPSKYVTLSNGKLVTQSKGTDGTRTDTWKMELPHAPYLFMMAVGDFKIYKELWKGKEVSYYLEPAYAPYAKQIFGVTPEMMTFFSDKVGIDYPWSKYSQIVVRDFVSGAMENTTATLHGEFVQQTDRELIDEYFGQGESVIAHELFHHWFGDYVTTESWSNLTVNESFANFSEVMWAEYKHGKDAGDAHNYEDMANYLGSKNDALKNLVRFHYVDKEEMFDLVSYQKGGRILNMLRNFLGEQVFYKGMNLYLKQNAFKSGEAHQLRLAMEEASGKDLNWFFNQWYFNAGHPILNIDYAWDAATKTQKVTIRQTQGSNLFTLPMAVDIYVGTNKQRHQITLKDSVQIFSFLSSTKPDLVNVDADKVLLAEKTDNKSLAEFAFQYKNAPLYLDRLEALLAAVKAPTDASSATILTAALGDKYYGIRLNALQAIDPTNTALLSSLMPAIKKMAVGDANTLVQAQAITMVASAKNQEDMAMFRKGLESRSYAVQGASLMALADMIPPVEALTLAKGLEKDNRKALTAAIVNVYAKYGTEKELPFVTEKYAALGTQEQINMTPAYVVALGKLTEVKEVKKGVDVLKGIGLKYKQYGANTFMTNFLGQLKQLRASDQESLTYIDAAIVELK
jgi:aminopeptidase N